jgi:hypothetical protein
MSQTATKLPLATAAGVMLLAANPVNHFAMEIGTFFVEEVVARAGADRQPADGNFAAEVAAWERMSDDLAANIGWE